MDNVSNIKFNYQLIRKPNKKCKNIFEYAACLNIVHRNKLFLTIDDICIIDFIHKLSLYDFNVNTYEIVPIDSEDKVLILKKIDAKSIEITSEWTENRMIVKSEELIESINLLKYNFERESKVKINKYYE